MQRTPAEVACLRSNVDSETDGDESKSRADNFEGDAQVLEPAGRLRSHLRCGVCPI